MSLKDEADLFPAQAAHVNPSQPAFLINGFSLQRDSARCGFHDQADTQKQGGLTRTTRPHEAHQLPGGYREGNILQRMHFQMTGAKHLIKTLNLQNWHRYLPKARAGSVLRARHTPSRLATRPAAKATRNVIS